MSDHDELVDLRHRRDEDEFTIEKLKNALAQAQAQASLAAARAQALEEAALMCEVHADELSKMVGRDLGPNYGEHDRKERDIRVKNQAYTARICGQRIRALITPSDSTALAKMPIPAVLDTEWGGDNESQAKLPDGLEAQVREIMRFSSREADAAPSGEGYFSIVTRKVTSFVAKLLAEERLAELNLIPQSEHWSTGLEGYIMRRKDTLMDILAARKQ